MDIEPLFYGKHDISSSDVSAVVEVLKSSALTQGPKVSEFERAFSDYVGSKYGVAVSNATAALHLSVLALTPSRPKSFKVITSPITFVSTANCVLFCGGEIEFADIDSSTYCLDPNRVEELLKKNPKDYVGMIPVDYAGHPSRLADFNWLAKKYGLWVISDSCHAPGASFTHEGKIYRAGDGHFADLTTFSFHPVKHIATGEGGIVTTNNEALYKKLLLMRSHGITKESSQMTEYDGGWDYEMQLLGFNYRIPDILCALGLSQLSRAKENLEKRRAVAEAYNLGLKDLPLKLPTVEAGAKHAYHLYVIRTAHRKELYEYLKSKEIHTQVHYIPVHEQPFYIGRYGRQSFPNSEAHYRECLSLPMYPTLSEVQQERVICEVKNFFDKKNG